MVSKRWHQGSRIVWMWMVRKQRCNRLHRTTEGFIATNCIRSEGGVIGETLYLRKGTRFCRLPASYHRFSSWFVHPLTLSPPCPEGGALKPCMHHGISPPTHRKHTFCSLSCSEYIRTKHCRFFAPFQSRWRGWLVVISSCCKSRAYLFVPYLSGKLHICLWL